MKPSWNDAPEWAQWLAMDENESWYWYELKPKLFNLVFDDDRGRSERAVKGRFEDSLEQRPKT